LGWPPLKKFEQKKKDRRPKAGPKRAGRADTNTWANSRNLFNKNRAPGHWEKGALGSPGKKRGKFRRVFQKARSRFGSKIGPGLANIFRAIEKRKE